MLTVQLWVGTIPYLKLYACHFWLVVKTDKVSTRWEVWQEPHQCKTSWHHLHKNLLPCSAWLKGQNHWLAHEWTGEVAIRLADILETSPKDYPHKQNYHYWPGPNSNSFIQYVLDRADAKYDLPPYAIGKDHQKWFQFKYTNELLHFYTPLLSLKYRRNVMFEFTILSIGLGVNFSNLSLRGPVTARMIHSNAN